MTISDEISRVKVAEVLLVEDNPADVRLTREAMKEGRVLNNLHVVGDGEAALDFLMRRPPYQDVPRPDLVLLDLNLPKKSGREVLAAMKSSNELKTIPIVVLTTSRAEEDILRSYELHANCFITKPVDLEKFISVVQQVESFWLSLVRLPRAD
ncbi:MAG: response regulator [Acidobacteriota bacterium]